MWERLDGGLTVLYEDQEIATQEAPPRASVLRRGRDENPYKDRARFMEQVEACLPTASKPARKKVVEARRPTPRMEAYWEAIHEAKRRGLSLREVARELGISRSTVMRYVKLNKPPVYGEGFLEEDKERGLTESLVSLP